MLVVVAEKRRKFTAEFHEGAVRIVTGTGKPVPEVAEDLGINGTTPASWVSRAKRAEKAAPEGQDALIARLTAENAALKKENKVEYVHRHTFRTRAAARIRIATWITDFYHTRRLHSVCEFTSPINHENDHRAGLTVRPAA